MVSKHVPSSAVETSQIRGVRAVNPFGLRGAAPPRSVFVAPSEAPRASQAPRQAGGDYYAVVSRGATLDAREVDGAFPAIEVRVTWGAHDVLEVAHLTPPRAFVVGEADALGGAADFALESGLLGASRWSLTRVDGDAVFVVVPRGASARVTSEVAVHEHAELLGMGRLAPSGTEPGSFELALTAGEAVSVSHKGFGFTVRAVSAARPLAAPSLRPDRALLASALGVATFVVASMGAFSLLAPSSASLSGDALDLENRYVQAMIAANEAAVPEHTVADTESATTESASGEAGEAGSPDEPTRRPVRTTSESDASTDAAAPVLGGSTAENNVVVDALRTLANMMTSGTTTGYQSSAAIGGDAMTMLGALVGGPAGLSGGMNGLTLAGTGLRGGGTGGDVIGGDPAGTVRLAEHYGRCTGDLCGVGERTSPRPVVRPPTEVSTTGGLTADQIRRVIQRNVSQVRHCYEQGLQRNPALSGRVTVSFVVSPTGAVMSSAASGDLGDTAVQGCVAGSVRRWSFPQPESGSPVQVRFPFVLSQSSN